jgi:hypothetical protein
VRRIRRSFFIKREQYPETRGKPDSLATSNFGFFPFSAACLHHHPPRVTLG